MLKTAVGRLRVIGFIEGISFLTLLFIAMPIKYIGGDPMPVKIVGMTHGILFLLFIAALLEAAWKEKWYLKFSVTAFICSLVPFGTFYLDRKLKQPALIPNRSL